MPWSVCTLVLVTAAIMVSLASVPAGTESEQGQAATRPSRPLTLFVCAKCSETCQLSRWGLFLSRADSEVHYHIAASKPCSAAAKGVLEIQVDVLTSDVMAGAWGAAGSAPDF